MKKRRLIEISIIIVSIILIAVTIAVVSEENNQCQQTQNSIENVDSQGKTAEKEHETSPEAAQGVETEKMTTGTSSAQNQQQNSQKPAQSQPQPQNQGAHVPFTQKDVTAGDSESYQNTVGQCPFYEMAGDKGCTPPPNIECNADWSVCTMKGE